MAARALVVAELASNWGGDLAVLHDLIAAAADAGADLCKLQIYDAAVLRDDDPQKAWLAQSQVSRDILDAALIYAGHRNVKLTASVFGIPQAQMALDAGLNIIKIGSGELHRVDLQNFCIDALCRKEFSELWCSRGLSTLHAHPVMKNLRFFYGISQYPTPYFRGLARLQQITDLQKSGAWGWSDHSEGIEVCKEAALHGATYIERHFSMPFAKRQSAWDSDAASLRELRDFCEEVAWEGTAEHQAACDKFLTRWSGQ